MTSKNRIAVRPTGSGKTLLMADAVAQALAKGVRVVLVTKGKAEEVVGMSELYKGKPDAD